MSWIVVTFGGPNPGWCDLSQCPSEAWGPFTTNDAAQQFLDTIPDVLVEQLQPHVLHLEEPGR